VRISCSHAQIFVSWQLSNGVGWLLRFLGDSRCDAVQSGSFINGNGTR